MQDFFAEKNTFENLTNGNLMQAILPRKGCVEKSTCIREYVQIKRYKTVANAWQKNGKR